MAVASAQPQVELAAALQGGSWWWRRIPFAHVVATNMFRGDLYEMIDRHYRALLDRGLSERPDADRFSRAISGYDVYARPLSHDAVGPLAPLLSPELHERIAARFGIAITGDVNGGFHHHPPGGKSGQIHNDLNPGWFVDAYGPDGINLSRPDLCSYQTGERHGAAEPYRVARGIACIFFLANGPWRSGDGGETGLYASSVDAVDRPCAAVPPIDNSAIFFACTPFSFHTFIRNVRTPRNSIVFWMHRPMQDVIAQWGSHSIVRWRRG